MCDDASLAWTETAPADTAAQAHYMRDLHKSLVPVRTDASAFRAGVAEFFRALPTRLETVTHLIAMQEHAFFGLNNAAQLVPIVQGFVNHRLLAADEASYVNACTQLVSFGEHVDDASAPPSSGPSAAVQLVLAAISTVAAHVTRTVEAAWEVFLSNLFTSTARGLSPLYWVSDDQLCDVARGNATSQTFAFANSAAWCVLRFFLGKFHAIAIDDEDVHDTQTYVHIAELLLSELRNRFRPRVMFPDVPAPIPLFTQEACAHRLARLFATDETTIRQYVFLFGLANANIGVIVPSNRQEVLQRHGLTPEPFKYSLVGIVFWLLEGMAKDTVFAPSAHARIRAFQTRCVSHAMFVRAQVQRALEAAYVVHPAGVHARHVIRNTMHAPAFVMSRALLRAARVCLTRYGITKEGESPPQWIMAWARATAALASGTPISGSTHPAVRALASACSPARGILTLFPFIQLFAELDGELPAMSTSVLVKIREHPSPSPLPSTCPVATTPLVTTLAQTAALFPYAKERHARHLPAHLCHIACSGLHALSTPSFVHADRPHVPNGLYTFKSRETYNLRSKMAAHNLLRGAGFGTVPDPVHLVLNILGATVFGEPDDGNGAAQPAFKSCWRGDLTWDDIVSDMLLCALLWRLGQDVRTQFAHVFWPVIPAALTTFGKKRARTLVETCYACFEPSTPASNDAVPACSHVLCTACTIRLLETRARAFLSWNTSDASTTPIIRGARVLQCGIDNCTASLSWATALLTHDIVFLLHLAAAADPIATAPSTDSVSTVPCGNCWGSATLDAPGGGVCATCSTCNLQTCAQCLLAAHPGVACIATQTVACRPEHILSEAKMQACPACAVRTVKDDGCNHMTCKCGCHWCWTCGNTLPLPTDAHYQPPSPCAQFLYSRHTETARIRARIEARSDLSEEARAHAIQLLVTTFAQETHDM